MAGTDARRRAGERTPPAGPVIILVAPQLAENIGMAARAMLNFGLAELRLVRPREPWPHPAAINAAAGADAVIDAAQLFDTAAEAVADLHHLAAATARRRDMVKPVTTPRRAAAEMRAAASAGRRWGVLFGPERAGLDNEDLALAETLISVPANPAFSSLNLAHAVLLIGYEWRQASAPARAPAGAMRKRAVPATKAEIGRFFAHLETELDASGFLYPPDKRPRMVRNIRNIFNRIRLTDQEVRTLRGIVTYLARGRRR